MKTIKRLICLVTALSIATALTGPAVAKDHPDTLYFGADLSYVNEMQDCGASYSYKDLSDPYEIFAASGHNLVRVRLWNNPDWTNYSNLADATKTIRQAKAAGMQVLLDFHYSDDWADGEKQIAPKEWAKLSTDAQAAALYSFTYNTLKGLAEQGLMPEMVQVGNETNKEIMLDEARAKDPINWTRNAYLLNAGIKAVRDISHYTTIKPKIMLHIAQPENVEWWFDEAIKAGVTDFDIIGISYYDKWSKYSMKQLGKVIKISHSFYKKEVIVVETAYPWTKEWADEAPNLMVEDSAFEPYGTSQKGQLDYVHDLMQLTIDNGGSGVVYWEPAWVSTSCSTRWGKGSHWENATFFDFNGKALPALEWPKLDYKK